jgi:hypothetical protein
VVSLAIQRAAHEGLCGAVAVFVLHVRRCVGAQRSFAHDADAFVEVALVAPGGDLAVHRHVAVGVDFGHDLVLDRFGHQRDAGEGRAAEAPDSRGVVLDAHTLRLGQDAAVVALHTVGEAAVGRLVTFVALGWIGVREVRVVHRACGGEGARLGVEWFPAGARDLTGGVGEVQLVETVGGGDFELRARIERPIDDVALPEIELDTCAGVEERELERGAIEVHVVRQLAHHAISVAEVELRIVGLVADALRDAVELNEARQVKLAADGAAAVGDVDRRVAKFERLNLDERDDLLNLRQERSLKRLRREACDGLVQRVAGHGRGNPDERHAHRAGVIGDHLPGQRFVGKTAGVRSGAFGVVIGRVVGECAVGAVLRFPKVAECDALGVA